MNKNQLILAIGGGVSAALVVGSAALAVFGLSGASAARADREKAFKELERAYRSDPFPSEENVETARANLSDAEDWIDSLDEALTRGTNDWERGLDLGRATPGEFSSLREETIQALYDAAPVGEDGTKILSDSFAFGFERYATGDPAQPAHVVRLLRQLRLTDQLVRMLYAAGPQRIDAVGRILFETGTGREDGSPRSRRRGGRDTSSSSSGSRDSALVVPVPRPQPGPVPSDVERFGFRFVAREAAILDFVDAIDAMQPWACVSGLAMEKTADDAVFPGEEAEKAPSGRRGTKDPAADPAAHRPKGPPKPPPRASRMVSGPLREAPVTATVFVDVRFVGRQPMGSGAPGEEEE